jgi:hypothetical protein
MKKLLVILALLVSLNCQSQTLWGRYIHSFTLECKDPDSTSEFGAYMTIYSGNTTVTGTTNKVFIISPCSGDVKVDTLIYKSVVTTKTFTLTFRCTDAAGSYTSQKRKVVLRKDSSGKRIISLVTTVL